MAEVKRYRYKTRTKVVVSNKAITFEKRLNDEIEKLENEGHNITHIKTDIGHAGKEGYMLLGTIVYLIEEWVIDADNFELHGFIDFGVDSNNSINNTEA